MRERNTNVGSVVFESGHDGVREREAAGCTQDPRRLQRADDVPGRRTRLHHGALGERLTIITAGNSDLSRRACASAEGTVHRYVDLARWRCARHQWPTSSTHDATPTIRPSSNQGLLDNRNMLTCQSFPYTCTPASLVPSPPAAPSSARRTARSPGTAAGCVQTFGAEGNRGSTRARARDRCSAAEVATRAPSSGCWCRTGAHASGRRRCAAAISQTLRRCLAWEFLDEPLPSRQQPPSVSGLNQQWCRSTGLGRRSRRGRLRRSAG